jgi:aspartyl protease family protein
MEELPPATPDTQGLGKVMVLLAWILAIILLTLFFSHWSKEYQMNTQPKMRTVDGIKQTLIKRNVQNQYMVQGTINGKSVIFLLDTGASDVVIPGNLAKDLQLLSGEEGMASTAGGNVTVYDTRINELVIGNIVLKNVAASINPKMDGEEILLGMSALRRITMYQQGDNLVLTVDHESTRE